MKRFRVETNKYNTWEEAVEAITLTDSLSVSDIEIYVPVFNRYIKLNTFKNGEDFINRKLQSIDDLIIDSEILEVDYWTTKVKTEVILDLFAWRYTEDLIVTYVDNKQVLFRIEADRVFNTYPAIKKDFEDQITRKG